LFASNPLLVGYMFYLIHVQYIITIADTMCA